MAVPLADKGVVVVAVGYDIAPKGRVFSFLASFCSWGGKRDCFIKMNIDVSAYAPFISFSGNMDLMVSQVRRSIVSVVQQYSHIRYTSFFLTCYHTT